MSIINNMQIGSTTSGEIDPLKLRKSSMSTYKVITAYKTDGWKNIRYFRALAFEDSHWVDIANKNRDDKPFAMKDAGVLKKKDLNYFLKFWRNEKEPEQLIKKSCLRFVPDKNYALNTEDFPFSANNCLICKFKENGFCQIDIEKFPYLRKDIPTYFADSSDKDLLAIENLDKMLLQFAETYPDINVYFQELEKIRKALLPVGG